MNQLDKLRQRNETMKLLSRKYNHKEGVVKINSGNTLNHELAKFLLCWKLANEGKQFVTEAIFENGKRADILVLDEFEAWEVLKSETEEQFKKKLDEYPCPAIAFKADDVLIDLFGGNFA